MIKLLHKKRCVAFATALVVAAMMLQGTSWALTSEKRDRLIQKRNKIQQAIADYEKWIAKYEYVYAKMPRGYTDEQRAEAELRALYLQANILKNEAGLETIDARLQGKEKKQIFLEQRIGHRKLEQAIEALLDAMAKEKILQRGEPRKYPWSKWSADIGVPIGSPMTLQEWVTHWREMRDKHYYPVSQTSEGPGPESSPADDTQVSETSEGPEPESSPADDTQVSETSEGPEPESSPADDTQGSVTCKCEDPQSIDTKPDGSIRVYGREPNQWYRARRVVCEIRNGTDSTIVLPKNEVGFYRYYQEDWIYEQGKKVKRWQPLEKSWSKHIEIEPQGTFEISHEFVLIPGQLGWKGLVEYGGRDGVYCKWNKSLVFLVGDRISWVDPETE